MNLLFDLDGTLTDPGEGIVACIQHALQSLGRAAPDRPALERHIGPPLRDSFRELLLDRPGEIDAAIAAYRERFVDTGMYENAVYEGIPEALDSLSQGGAVLFVATSKPVVYARRILEHFSLARHFRAVHGSGLDGARTDKGDLIAHVLAAECLLPRDTVMVGDRSHDALGALRNDVFPVGVLWGYGSRRELSEAGAQRLMARPQDLSQLLGGVDWPTDPDTIGT